MARFAVSGCAVASVAVGAGTSPGRESVTNHRGTRIRQKHCDCQRQGGRNTCLSHKLCEKFDHTKTRLRRRTPSVSTPRRMWKRQTGMHTAETCRSRWRCRRCRVNLQLLVAVWEIVFISRTPFCTLSNSKNSAEKHIATEWLPRDHQLSRTKKPSRSNRFVVCAVTRFVST